MVGNQNFPVHADHSSDIANSSASKSAIDLDAERAASMADEGGVAGAIMDAVEQEASLARTPTFPWQKWALWGGLAAFAFGATVAVLRRRERNRYRFPFPFRSA
jgi:hypothetical protein